MQKKYILSSINLLSWHYITGNGIYRDLFSIQMREEEVEKWSNYTFSSLLPNRSISVDEYKQLGEQDWPVRCAQTSVVSAHTNYAVTHFVLLPLVARLSLERLIHLDAPFVNIKRASVKRGVNPKHDNAGEQSATRIF